MACRKNTPGQPCCNTVECPEPELIENISFNSINKVPADWFYPGTEGDKPNTTTCCPFVHWDIHGAAGLIYSDMLLKQCFNYNNSACSGTNPQLFCTRAYLWNMTLWITKTTCDPTEWLVIMRAKIWVGMSMTQPTPFDPDDPVPPECAAFVPYSGFVYLYREKLISSLTAPTTITFTEDDHYDSDCNDTAVFNCSISGGLPSTEISTTAYYLCDDTYVNPITLNFIDIDFSFGIT